MLFCSNKETNKAGFSIAADCEGGLPNTDILKEPVIKLYDLCDIPERERNIQ